MKKLWALVFIFIFGITLHAKSFYQEFNRIKKDSPKKAIDFYLEHSKEFTESFKKYEPLKLAIKHNLKEYYEVLVLKGALVDDKEHRNIDTIIKRKDYNSLKLFKKLGMDINHIDKYGNSYFFRNVHTYKDMQMLKLLLKLGYKLPNFQNSKKITRMSRPKWFNDISFGYKFLVYSDELELINRFENLISKYNIHLEYHEKELQLKDGKYYIKDTNKIFTGLKLGDYNGLDSYVLIKNGLKDGIAVVKDFNSRDIHIQNLYEKGVLLQSVIYQKVGYSLSRQVVIVYDKNTKIKKKLYFRKDGEKSDFPKSFDLEKTVESLKGL